MNDPKPTSAINDLLENVDGFESSLFPPTRELCEHDTVLGECPEALRKFFAYSRFCEREMKQLAVDLEYTSEPDEEKNYRLWQLNKQRDVASLLFWFCLWEWFHAYGSDKEIGIRAGWKVVEHTRQRPELPPFLRGILGLPEER